MIKNIKKVLAVLVIIIQVTGIRVSFAGEKDLPIVLGAGVVNVQENDKMLKINLN